MGGGPLREGGALGGSTVFIYLFLPFSGEKKASVRRACGAKHARRDHRLALACAPLKNTIK